MDELVSGHTGRNDFDSLQDLLFNQTLCRSPCILLNFSVHVLGNCNPDEDFPELAPCKFSQRSYFNVLYLRFDHVRFSLFFSGQVQRSIVFLHLLIAVENCLGEAHPKLVLRKGGVLWFAILCNPILVECCTVSTCLLCGEIRFFHRHPE